MATSHRNCFSRRRAANGCRTFRGLGARTTFVGPTRGNGRPMLTAQRRTVISLTPSRLPIWRTLRLRFRQSRRRSFLPDSNLAWAGEIPRCMGVVTGFSGEQNCSDSFSASSIPTPRKRTGMVANKGCMATRRFVRILVNQLLFTEAQSDPMPIADPRSFPTQSAIALVAAIKFSFPNGPANPALLRRSCSQALKREAPGCAHDFLSRVSMAVASA